MPPDHSYEPTGYGAGVHTNVVSSNGDFTLRYTISVTPPPAVPVVGNEPDFGFCNNNLPISGVTSSGSQSQALPPSNTIDNKLFSILTQHLTWEPKNLYAVLILLGQMDLHIIIDSMYQCLQMAHTSLTFSQGQAQISQHLQGQASKICKNNNN